MEPLAGMMRLIVGVIGLIVLFIAYDRYKAWRVRAGGITQEDGKAITAIRFGVRVLVWLFILYGVLAIAGILLGRYQDRAYQDEVAQAVKSAPTSMPSGWESRRRPFEAGESLVAAVKDGDLERVIEVLQKADPHDQHTYLPGWQSPLAMAVQQAPKDARGDAIILYLLARGADANDPEDLLATVIRQNRLGLVGEFLRRGASAQPAMPAALGCECDERLADVFMQLLEHGAVTHEKGYDLYSRSAREDNLRLLHEAQEKWLARQGDTGDAITADGQTRLIAAVAAGDPATVRRYLANGADPNRKAPSGSLPLGRAVMWNDEEIVRLLLTANADPHLPEDHGSTPLSLAAGSGFDGNLDILRMLLAFPGELGPALKTAVSANKRYALRYLLAAAGPLSMESIQNAVSASSRQFAWFTSLLPEFVAALPPGIEGQRVRLLLLNHPSVTDEQRSELLEYLLASGLQLAAEVRYYSDSPRPVFDYLKEAFIHAGHTKSLELLERAYARERLGEPAWLHKVIITRDMRALNRILSEGMDPNALQTEGGETPLALALATGWHGGVRALLQAGADPHLPVDRFGSAYALAAVQGDSDLVSLLDEKHYPGSVDTLCGRIPLAEQVLGRKLFDAVQSGETACTTALLDAGAKPHWKDFRGWTAVHEAAYQGNIELLQLVLEHDGDAGTPSRWSLTPMHWAGYKPMAEYFHQLRRNLHAKEPDLRDDDYRQAMAKVTEVMDLLLAAGASPNLDGWDDGTPLMIAIANDDLDRIRVLDEHGADWHVGSERKKPLHLLGPNNSFATYRYLLTESRLTRRLASGEIADDDAAYNVVHPLIRTALRRDDVDELEAMFMEVPFAPGLRRKAASTLLNQLVPRIDQAMRQAQVSPGEPDTLATIRTTLGSPKRWRAVELALEQLGDETRISGGHNRTLLAAVTANDLAATELLLRYRLADPNHRDGCGNSMADVARVLEFTDMSALLQRHGAEATGTYRECAR